LLAEARLDVGPRAVHPTRLLEPSDAECVAALGARVLDKSETSRSSLIEALTAVTGGGPSA
jgi:hypothetical protein